MALLIFEMQLIELDVKFKILLYLLVFKNVVISYDLNDSVLQATKNVISI